MVNEMRDAFVVLDANDCFVNANIAAKRLFTFLNKIKFGSEIPEEHRGYFTAKNEEYEFSIILNEREYFYKASVGFIKKRGKSVCKTFVFYDITDTKMLINELDQKVSYDNLTGIYNRATLMRYLYIIQEKSDIENVSSAVLLVDIDKFKVVNDTLGYSGGDIILVEVVNRIKTALREHDIFARYGGEEFCVAIWNTDQNAALEEAEKIREIIEATPFTAAGMDFSVTVSIGVSLYFPEEEKRIETVITEADQALSDAKDGGRNQCNIFYKAVSVGGGKR
jgi:diguanylate cyclase (GGDEF)-like protein